MAETLKKGSRVTGAAREKLAADLKKKYDSGASIRALAEETGRSYGFVHRMLSESGVTCGVVAEHQGQEGRLGLTEAFRSGSYGATRSVEQATGWLLFSHLSTHVRSAD